MISGIAVVPALALAIDTLIGDPRSSWHPVVVIGSLISFLERLLLKPEHSPARKKASGVVLVLVVLSLTYGLLWLVMAGLATIHPWAVYVGGALLLSFAITPRSLAEAGRELQTYLENGDMEQARYKVGWIVGRDTAKLDTAEVTRATVETVAENIVDGIISPLFFAALGGVPLAFLYRAVNTLDSMVGYKNDKYRDFGWAGARIDDLFNYIPARITGLLIVVAAFLLGYNAKGAARIILRDAAKHPSPNSGFPEAGVAGALGIRLGGLNFYGGVPSQRAHMGDPLHELIPVHIAQTTRVMYTVTILFLLVSTAVLLVFAK